MEVIDQSIFDIAVLLREPGVEFEFGCIESDYKKNIQIALKKYPGKPYCVVRDWVLWDIKVNDEERNVLEANFTKPIVVHAKFVVEDQTGQAAYGNYRISTPMVEMVDPCFFITRNTVYILLGSGTRKDAAAKDVAAFYF